MSKNEFELELPTSKAKLTWKILTGADEDLIENELKSLKKLKRDVVPQLTTRMKHVITSVNGEKDQTIISNFVDNMLSRDSIVFRNEMQNTTPDSKNNYRRGRYGRGSDTNDRRVFLA